MKKRMEASPDGRKHPRPTWLRELGRDLLTGLVAVLKGLQGTGLAMIKELRSPSGASRLKEVTLLVLGGGLTLVVLIPLRLAWEEKGVALIGELVVDVSVMGVTALIIATVAWAFFRISSPCPVSEVERTRQGVARRLSWSKIREGLWEE